MECKHLKEKSYDLLYNPCHLILNNNFRKTILNLELIKRYFKADKSALIRIISLIIIIVD